MTERKVATYAWVYEDEKFKHICRIRKFKDSTKKNMAVSLNEYCKFIEKEYGHKVTPSQLYQEASREQNTIIDNYITPVDDRKVSSYIGNYMEFVEKLDKAPRTKAERIRNVRQFYNILKITLPDLKIERPDGRKENHYIPTLKDLQRALAANKVTRTKAIILTQASSGCGTGELVALTKADFYDGYDEDTGITMFRPTRKKTGRRYRTFITPEASDAIKDWLLVADKNDVRLFEIEEFGLIDMYQHLNDKAGFDTPKGQYDHIRSHAMRKYFHNTLMNKGAPSNLINYLCGRSESEVDRAYSSWEDDVLRTEYLKYMEYLSVSPLRVKVIESAEYTAIKGELEAEKSRNLELEHKLQLQNEEMIKMLAHERKERIQAVALMEENNMTNSGDVALLRDMVKNLTTELKIVKETTKKPFNPDKDN